LWQVVEPVEHEAAHSQALVDMPMALVAEQAECDKDQLQ
jgi:hypothetical protein